MLSARASLALLGLAYLAGCGDNLRACTTLVAHDNNIVCAAAQGFVTRDSVTVVPTQSEVDRYFDRWLRATETEPLFVGVLPQRFRNLHQYFFDTPLDTENRSVIDAWSRGQVATGDAAFDALMAPIEVVVEPYNSNDGQRYEFYFKATTIFAEEPLQAGLLPTGSHLNDAVDFGRTDAKWRWLDNTGGPTGSDAATASIDVAYGWGDCWNGCIYVHRARLVVPAVGPVLEYDLGGDPFLPGMALSPNAQPLP
jgi:hypothetical protein